MLVIAVSATGAVVGFIWQKRRSRRRDEGTAAQHGGAEDENSGRPQAVVASAARRAFVTSLLLLRTTTFHAFKRTALHYAPVPLTFSTAVLSALPAIFGTAFSVNFVVVNGLSLVGNYWLTGREAGGEDAGPRRAANLTHIACCGGGVVGFVLFQRRWENSPLRGSLSVFGKDPKLDRCASAERYLAEKVALLAYAGYRRVATLRQIMGAARGTDSEAESPAEAAVPLGNYARQVISRTGLVLHEVEEVFSEYSERYISTHQEMSVLSNKLRYPQAVSHLEPAISKVSDALMAPLRTRNAASDVKAKLDELKEELGYQFNARVMLLLLNLAGGAFLGVELAQLPWLNRL